MHSFFRKVITLFLLALLHFSSNAQIRNSEKNITLSKDSSLLQTIINQFKGKPNPFIDSTFINLNKYVQQVAKYEGKRIRSIQIEQKHFGTSITNTSNLKNDVVLNTLKEELEYMRDEALDELEPDPQEGIKLNNILNELDAQRRKKLH